MITKATGNRCSFICTKMQRASVDPCWVAYASHDFKGDDLRRRWDDPLLVKQGQHPGGVCGRRFARKLLRAGRVSGGHDAGLCHAAGADAATGAEIDDQRFGDADSRAKEPTEGTRPFLSIPNIDYARGDGLRIGQVRQRNGRRCSFGRCRLGGLLSWFVGP